MIKSLLLGFLLFFSGCGSGGSSMPENIFPTANMTVNKTSLNAGEVLSLDASRSTDSDGTITSYEWLTQDNELLGTQKTTTWTAPSLAQAKVYKITLIVTDDEGAKDSISLDVIVNAYDDVKTPFSTIRTLISSGNATYICVGDSTRNGPPSPYYNANANPLYATPFVFDTIKASLDDYNVNSILLTRQGHEAKQFNLGTQSPTWEDVVSRIPTDGSTTIVDISLGVNDLFSAENNYAGSASDITTDITAAINKIKAQKPNTLFMLTMPNPEDPASSSATDYDEILRSAYVELSTTLNLPLVSIMDNINFTSAMYQNDLVHFHLVPSAQQQVANFILTKILPQ